METIGRYQVVRVLGHGGVGEVFLARDPTLERDVAIKLLRADAWQSGLREEAKALAALNHPGIVTIYEIGEHAGQDFIAMEYLSGRTLRQILAERTANRAELLNICAKVATAVSASHAAGILHRDIKPENIVVGARGHVKVVDFGIARRLGGAPEVRGRPVTAGEAADVIESFKRTVPPPEGGTATIVNLATAMWGTPAYMAPEVLLGAPSTAASDVYSLGVVVYECLAGKRPYDAQGVVEVMAQMIEEPPAVLDDPLGAYVAAMLASDPVQRPALEAIDGALAVAVGPSPLSSSSSSRLATAHGFAPAATVPSPSPMQPISGLSAARVAQPAKTIPFGVAPKRKTLIAPAHEPAILPAPKRRRTAMLATLLIAGAAAIAIAWIATHREVEPATPGPAAAAPPVVASVAVGALALSVPSYGSEPPTPPAVADVLAHLFDQVSGAKLSGIQLSDGDARAVGAAYLLSGAITEDAGELRAHLELTRVATGERVSLVQLHRPAPQMAQLLDAIALDVARHVAPGAAVDLASNRVRAEVFYRKGEEVLESGRFTLSRPYLEQAVDADPKFFDAWYALALVLGWMDAPEEQEVEATAQALATAVPGPKRDFMTGVARFLGGDFAGAREALEPLEARTGADAPSPRELFYFLGEANWHDGRHDAAYAYFKRALAADPRFHPPAVHAWQYTLARRDENGARYYLGLAGDTTVWVDLEQGKYAQVAATRHDFFQTWAELSRGGPLSEETQKRMQGPELDPTTMRIARALEAGDVAGAKAELAALWPRLVAQRDAKTLTATDDMLLEVLGEVTLSGGLVEDSKRLVELVASRSTPRKPARGYQRLAALTAALSGDRTLIVREGLTERGQRIVEAADAELSGDRKRAASIYRALVADPTFSWDYPERAALIRNLRALRDKKGVAAVCADTLRPAVFRTAMPVLRRVCK